MKRLSALSETPKVRALAWVVCIVGLALCLVCGQQAAWVAQRGGYQPNGYTTVVENEVNQVLQDYTQTIAQEYTLARENDGSVDAIRYLIDDENFGFQIVRDRGAVLLSQNTIDEEVYALTCTVHTSFIPTETTTFQETYATESEREQALETLYRQYEDVEYNYGSVGTEEETGRYTLFATCFSQGDPVPVTVTGYASDNFTSSDSELFCAKYFAGRMAYYRYEFVLTAVVGGVLGALALALLVYGAGYRRNEDGTLALPWLDRRVSSDLLGVGMAVVAILWCLLGGLDVSSAAERSLSVLPIGHLIGTGVVAPGEGLARKPHLPPLPRKDPPSPGPVAPFFALLPPILGGRPVFCGAVYPRVYLPLHVSSDDGRECGVGLGRPQGPGGHPGDLCHPGHEGDPGRRGPAGRRQPGLPGAH